MGIRVLGPVEVDGSGPLSPRDRVVLAALSLHPRDAMSAERLADALWGEDLPASWQKVVQGCVLRLRRVLGRDALETTVAGYRLMVADEEIDCRRFERLALRGRALAATGEYRRAALAYSEALALWRGPALADLEHWLDGHGDASRLAELRSEVEESLVEAQVWTGDDGVAAATSLVVDDPLRERRWALLATALYQSNRQADALAALRRARSTLAEELGLDPGAQLVALERAILSHDPALARSPAPAGPGWGVCPYKGLVAYDREDAELFFGRGDEVARCLQTLSRSPLLVVVGPSGCGKSSLVQAGVVPSLEAVGRQLSVMTPGTDPTGALVQADSVPDRSPSLVVDQLEELFTGGHERAVVVSFLDRLADLASSGRRVIAVVRADHVSALSVSPGFARLAEGGLHLVTPMTPDEMRAGIESPAAQAGLRLEPGLVDLLLLEVEGEPGALPLLSHALAETWERREADVLTIDGYHASGGIRSAVAQSAELLYEALDAGQRAAVRSTFLRLVTPSLDGEPVATRVPMSAVAGDPDRARVLDQLVRARLVTTDAGSVVLAHEAVVRAWPRLQSWLDEDVEGRRTLRHLSLAADDWAARGHPDSELYRGARLEGALDWRARESPDLTVVEARFLDASDAYANAEEAAARERVREQARHNRRLRVALVGTAVCLALALVAGIAAVQQGRTAYRSASAAQVERLLAQSLALRATRRDLAALLALEAYRLDPGAATASAVFSTFTVSPGFLGYERTPEPLASGQVMTDGHTLLAVGVDGVVREVDLRTGEVRAQFPAPLIRPAGALIALSVDGHTVAEVSWEQGPPDGAGRVTLVAYDVATHRPRFPQTRLPTMDVGALAISPDGTHVAISGDADGGHVLIFDTPPAARLPVVSRFGSAAGHRGVRELPSLTGSSGLVGRHAAALLFLDVRHLVVGSDLGLVRVVDPMSGEELARVTQAPLLTSNDLAFALRDGSVVTTGSAGITRWDLRAGRRTWTVPVTEDRCASAAVSPTAESLLCGSNTGQVISLDLRDGVPTRATYDLQRSDVSGLALTRDGRTLVEMTDTQPVLAQWRLDGTGPVAGLLPVRGRPIQFSSDGRLLIVLPSSGDADGPEVVDARTGAVLVRLRGLFAPVWTQEPDLLVAWNRLGNGFVLNARSHRQLLRLQGNMGGPSDPGRVSTRGSRLLVWGGGNSAVDKMWRVWNTGSGEIVSSQLAPPTVWNSAVLTPDGRQLVTAGDGGLVVYDVASGAARAQAPGVVDADISPTGAVVGSTPDGALVFLDRQSLAPSAASLPGVGVARQLAFGAGGRLLVVRGTDGSVRVVDMDQHIQLGEPIAADPKTPADGTVALSPDGAELALPGPAGLVVWLLRPAVWQQAACQVAGRNLSRAEWDTYLAGLGDYHETCPDAAAAG